MKFNILFPFGMDFFGTATNPCVRTLLHIPIHHIILHLSLLVMRMSLCVFALDLCVCLLCCWDNKSTFSREKNSITSAVGCSTNMTRVLEFESIILFSSSKEITIHMRRHMLLSNEQDEKIRLKMLAHFVGRLYALKRRKNAFEVDEYKYNGLDNGNNFNKQKSKKITRHTTLYNSRVSRECICRVHVLEKKNKSEAKETQAIYIKMNGHWHYCVEFVVACLTWPYKKHKNKKILEITLSFKNLIKVKIE